MCFCMVWGKMAAGVVIGLAGIAALVVYGLSRAPAALAVTVTLDVVAIGAFAALLGAEVYYEKRM